MPVGSNSINSTNPFITDNCNPIISSNNPCKDYTQSLAGDCDPKSSAEAFLDDCYKRYVLGVPPSDFVAQSTPVKPTEGWDRQVSSSVLLGAGVPVSSTAAPPVPPRRRGGMPVPMPRRSRPLHSTPAGVCVLKVPGDHEQEMDSIHMDSATDSQPAGWERRPNDSRSAEGVGSPIYLCH